MKALVLSAAVPKHGLGGLLLWLSLPDLSYPQHTCSHAPPCCVACVFPCSRCGNGCECPERYLDGSLTYNQLVTFIDGITPTAAPKCQISIAMAQNATAGDKVRINGIAVTSDPGLISNARIGETKYMAWLLGDKWAA